MQTTNLLGRKVRFQSSHSDGSVVNFSARIVKLYNAEMVWVEIPERVRNLPFPPLDGKRYGLFPIAKLQFVQKEAK